MPISSSWKAELRQSSSDLKSLAYMYSIENVLAFLFNLGGNQVRAVYVSCCGHLFEYPESMPHLKRLGILDIITSRLVTKKKIASCTHINSSYLEFSTPILWSAFQTNYTHFLLDEFSHRSIASSSKLALSLRPSWLQLSSSNIHGVTSGIPS